MNMLSYTQKRVRRGGIFLGLLACLFPAIYGQTTVSGTVSDASGAGLVGASVVVKGTSGGALSGDNGAYRVAVPAGATTLVFSYLGYQKQEVLINGRTQIDVKLAEEDANLGEVVIIGYGQQQKKDLTTSVATVTARDIRDQPVNSFDQALVGKIAGVQIQQTSGAPGAGLSVRPARGRLDHGRQ